MIEMKPFERYDSVYLEGLNDEEFFSRRFEISKEDQEIIEKNSKTVNGRTFYKKKVVDEIYKKYAKETNPSPGEPGSPENPLVRFGKKYVYSDTGELIEDVRGLVKFTLNKTMKLTDAQMDMVLKASKMPIVYDEDCPKSTPDMLESFREYGRERNKRRQMAQV